MRVLVVDDSAFMRRAISYMLDEADDIEVIATGCNGMEAIELAKNLRPDVITMDIEMPQMDGLTALRHIMRQSPTQVIMLSSLTIEGSHVALQALKLGAADVLAKDMSQISLSITNIQQDLIQRVRALGNARSAASRRAQLPQPPTHTLPVFQYRQFDIICIGSSTGGPPVLETILDTIPSSMTTPIVIAQHMPEIFTRSMAQRLDDQCQLRVLHIQDNMPLEPGTIYIAPGGKNTHIQKVGLAKWKLIVNKTPASTIYWPSANALLLSAANNTGQRTLAIILTGIGEDGLQGARALHQKHGTILAQNEETCVVYGMPKAVTENALIAASLSPQQMNQSISNMAKPASKPISRAG